MNASTPARSPCPQCRQPRIPPEGPPKATVGCLFLQPLQGREALDAKKVLGTELHMVGLNLLLVRVAWLWPHAPNSSDSLEKHLRYTLRAVSKCAVVLLFGTHVTQVVLDEGVSGIIGLKRTSPLLPGVMLLPCPSPETVPAKTLGEFRLVMQLLAKEVTRL